MEHSASRRRALHTAIFLGIGSAMPAVRACEFFTAGFRIVHPWTRATSADDTSAVVCMTFDDVTRADRLIGAESPVCRRVELGGHGAKTFVDFLIPEGQTTVMSETGTHLRLIGLNFELPVGREYPLTLIFQKSGSVAATLSIDYQRFR